MKYLKKYEMIDFQEDWEEKEIGDNPYNIEIGDIVFQIHTEKVRLVSNYDCETIFDDYDWIDSMNRVGTMMKVYKMEYIDGILSFCEEDSNNWYKVSAFEKRKRINEDIKPFEFKDWDEEETDAILKVGDIVFDRYNPAGNPQCLLHLPHKIILSIIRNDIVSQESIEPGSLPPEFTEIMSNLNKQIYGDNSYEIMCISNPENISFGDRELNWVFDDVHRLNGEEELIDFIDRIKNELKLI